VSHKCLENGNEMWFLGDVIGIKKVTENTLKQNITLNMMMNLKKHGSSHYYPT
jgi:hypothetical protein